MAAMLEGQADAPFIGDTFTLTVTNPAARMAKGGLTVLQQTVPYRRATVRVRMADSGWRVATHNVLRLEFRATTGPPAMQVDGVAFARPYTGWGETQLCKHSGVWARCGGGETDGGDDRREPHEISFRESCCHHPFFPSLFASHASHVLRRFLHRRTIIIR